MIFVYCINCLTRRSVLESGYKICLCVIEAMRFSEESRAFVKNLRSIINPSILFLSRTKTEDQRIKEKIQAIDQDVDEYLTFPLSVEEYWPA